MGGPGDGPRVPRPGAGEYLYTRLANPTRRTLEECLAALEEFAFAVSFDGVESLVEHPATMTPSVLSAEERAAVGIGDGLVRLSVGIEHEADLVADVERGLATVEERVGVDVGYEG